MRLNVGKYCFSNKVCDDWNGLPGEVVNAGSVDGSVDSIRGCSFYGAIFDKIG